MRLIAEKTELRIVPESVQDEVYLESVLRLYKKDDTALAVRVPPVGMTSPLGYVRILAKEAHKA